MAAPQDPKPTRPVLYSLVMVLVVGLATGIGSAIYSVDTAREGDRKWCSLVATLDDAYRVTPPSTETGKLVASQIHQLRMDFDCPK